MPFVVVADIERDDADRIAGDQVAVVRFVVESESEDPAQLFRSGIRIRLSTVRGVRDGYISRR